LEIFLVLHYIFSFAFEIFDMFYLRLFYIKANGSIPTLLAWLSNIFFLAAFILRMVHIPVAEEVCLAVAAIAAWFYFLHLIRALHANLGTFVGIISEVIAYDLGLFIFLYVVIVMAFSCGMTLLG